MGSWISSPDGLWVAFTSRARTLVPGDTNGVADIFLRSVTGQQTTRVSVAADGTQADGASQSPGVSAGAQRIVFASSATNLVPGDTNGLRDVFLVVRASGQVVRLSETVEVNADGVNRVNADGGSDTPSIDDAGRAVAFATLARNLVPALASSTTAQIVVATLPASPAAAGRASEVPGAQALAADAADRHHGRAEATGVGGAAAGDGDGAAGRRREHAAGGVRQRDVPGVCDRRDEPDAGGAGYQRGAGRGAATRGDAAADGAAAHRAPQHGRAGQPRDGGQHAHRAE